MAFPIIKVPLRSEDPLFDAPTITDIKIVKDYAPTGSETFTFDMSAAGDNSITGYRDGTTFIIWSHGAEKIQLPAECFNLFIDFENTTILEGINLFDSSNVDSLNHAFTGLKKVKQIDLSSWRTPKLTDIVSMCSTGKWSSEFSDKGCEFEYINLSNWDLSHIVYASQCFASCNKLTEIRMDNIIPLKLTINSRDSALLDSPDSAMAKWGSSLYISGMFYRCSALKSIDISEWDISNAYNVEDMFHGCSSLNVLNTSHWETSKIRFAAGFAEGCSALKQLDVSNWDTSNLEDPSFMFYGCTSLPRVDVSKWNTAKCTTFDHIFARAGMEVPDTTKWDTSSCKNFNGMFHSCHGKTIDVSNFDTSKGEVFAQMFEGNPELEEIIGLEQFNTSNGIAFEEMFYNCPKLKRLDLTSFDTRKAKDGVKISENKSTSTTMKDFIGGTTKLDILLLGPNFSYNGDGTTTEPLNHASITYDMCKNDGTPVLAADALKTVPIYLYSPDLPMLAPMGEWFDRNSNGVLRSQISHIYIDDNYTPPAQPQVSWDASFSHNGKITCYVNESNLIISIPLGACLYANSMSMGAFGGNPYNYSDGFENVLDINNIQLLDTSLVDIMTGMFYNCANLQSIDATNFDLSRVQMGMAIFSGCETLESIDLSNWSSSALRDTSSMFENCRNLHNINISKLNTSNVGMAKQMFSGCTELKQLDLSSFDTSSIITMQDMFKGCNFDILRLGEGFKYNGNNIQDVTNQAALTIDMYKADGTKIVAADALKTVPVTLYGANVPMLAKRYDWLGENIDRTGIKTWKFVESYKPTGQEKTTWDASFNKNGQVTGYLIGDEQIVVANNSNKIIANEDCSMMCAYEEMETILGLEYIDFSNTLNMSHMFELTPNLVKVDISTIHNTFNVTDMTAMFSKVQFEIDVSSLDTSNVTSMRGMFTRYMHSKLILPYTFDTSKVTDMLGMFAKCEELKTLDLTYFDTRKVTDLNLFNVSDSRLVISPDVLIIGPNFKYDGNGITDPAKLPACKNNMYKADGTEVLGADVFKEPSRTLYSSTLPMLKPKDGWIFNNPAGVTKESITTITLKDSHTPTGQETATWDVSFNNAGTVTCYVTGTDVIIAGNGTGEIYAPEDALRLMGGMPELQTINSMDVMSTKYVQSMSGMFSGCNKLSSLNLNAFDTSNTTNMSNMFYNCYSLTSLDLSSFNTSYVTDMLGMFDHCTSLINLDLSSFNTSYVTDMSAMFAVCGMKVLNLLSFDTSNVTNMMWMFGGCHISILDISSFDTSSLAGGISRWLFTGSTQIDKIIVGDKFIRNSNNAPEGDRVIDMPYDMYKADGTLVPKADAFKTVPITLYSTQHPTIAPKSTWFDKNTNSLKKDAFTKVIFSDSYSPTGQETATWDVTYNNDGRINCYVNGSELTVAGSGSGKIMANEDSSNMFFNFKNVAAINNFELLDTGNTTNMSGMFFFCKKLNQIASSHLITKNVVNMAGMFGRCESLQSFDFTNFNTQNVTNMWQMFWASGFQSLDLSAFNTSNVTNMNSMFSECSNLTDIDLHSFNTSNVTDFAGMFCYSPKLKILDLSTFDTRNATSLKWLFDSSKPEKLTLGSEFKYNGNNIEDTADHAGLDYNVYDINGNMIPGEDAFKTVPITLYSTQYPTIAPGNTWFNSNPNGIKKNIFTTLNIVDNYQPTDSVTATWDATNNHDGRINCYVDGDTLTIAGCGCGKIIANEDSSFMFSENIKSTWDFNNMPWILQVINGLDVLDTSHIKTMEGMFYGLKMLSQLDLRSFNTETVENMAAMFERCERLALLNLSSFNTEKVISINDKQSGLQNIFTACKFDKLILGTRFKYNGNNILETSKQAVLEYDVYDLDGNMTPKADALKTVPATLYSTPYPIFAPNCTWFDKNENGLKRNTITEIKILDSYSPKGTESVSWDASAYNDDNLHCYVDGTKLIIAGNGRGKIQANRDSSFIFSEPKFADLYNNIESLSLDVLDTGNVLTMYAMFAGCTKLKQLDLTHLNTSHVYDMGSMFDNCPELTHLDVSMFDTRHVQNMSYMFAGSNIQNLDLSSFVTTLVTNMDCMFWYATGIKTLDLSNFHTVNVTSMKRLFSSCRFDKLIIGSKFKYNGANITDPYKQAKLDYTSYDFAGHEYAGTEALKVVPVTLYSNLDTVRNTPITLSNGALIDIANAIRTKNGQSSERYTPAQMAQAIQNIGQ